MVSITNALRVMWFFIPKGTVHAFKNIGSDWGKLRYAFSPANTIEKMFREFFAALENGNITEDQMAKIAINHGQEFVGPPL